MPEAAGQRLGSILELGGVLTGPKINDFWRHLSLLLDRSGSLSMYKM